MGTTFPPLPIPRRDVYGPGYYELDIPAGFRELDLALLGTAGGAGSGRRGASGSLRTGGATAAGAGVHKARLTIADLGGAGAILPLYVGYGGPGGAKQTVDSTNGVAGSQGGPVGLGTIAFPAAWPLPTGPSATGSVISGVASNANVIVAVGAAGKIYSSPDGSNWTQQTSGTANALYSVTWAAALGLFVAVGTAGTIVTSPDGTAWTVQTSGTANALNYVMFDGTTLIAVGAAGTILTSTNATVWATNAYTSANALNQVATDAAGHYAAADSGGQVVKATSPTGTWTAAQVTPVATQSANGIAFGAGLWVMNCGSIGNTYTSSDLTTWTYRNAGLQRAAHPMNFVSGASPIIPSDVPGGVAGLFIHERNWSLDGLNWFEIAHSGAGPVHAATLFKGALYCSANSAWFVSKIARLITAFRPIHIMGTYGGLGGSTGAALQGSTDGSATLPGAPGQPSAVSGTTPAINGAVGSGSGGPGGGATAANAAIVPASGAEGSISGSYTAQGFNGISGVNSLDGYSAGTDPTLNGSSGGGGGAWQAATPGQDGGKGGTPGGSGGGGAASDNGYNSGKGGDGGDGQARLLWL